MADNNYYYDKILKENQKNKKSFFNFKKTYPAYLVLILFLILSFFIWDQAKLMVKNNQKQEFRKATNSVISRLEAKKQRKLEVINSISVLFDIFPFKVPKDYFELYSTVPTMTYPSILGVIYAPKVSNEEKGAFVYNAKSMGYYDYYIHPEGERQVYFPSEYIIPLESNIHQLGFDYYTNDDLKTAMNKAMKENILVTSPVKNYGRNDTVSFYMISPLYEKDSETNTENQRINNFDAAVLLEIKADLYFKNAIKSAVTEEKSTGFASDSSIYFRIFDLDYEGKKNVIYQSDNSHFFDKAGFTPLINEIIDYQLADRTIKIEFATVPDFGGKFQTLLPLITLIIAIFVSFAFFGFLHSLISSRARAVDLAEKMTRSQRRIVETSNDMIAIMDFNAIWQSMNPASDIILGYTPEEMNGTPLKQYLKNPEDFNNFDSLVKNAEEDVHNKFDVEMLSKDGEVRWVSWSITISKTDNVIYALGRDVTLEKLAEQQAILKSKQIQLAQKYAQEASESKSFFMTKLSHQLRNNLTGIIGYLQLLDQKIYENEEEHDSFVKLAEESSEEIFTFVSDIIEATINSDNTDSINYEIIQFGKIQQEMEAELKSKYAEELNIKISFNEEAKTSKALADGELLKDALTELTGALTQNKPNSAIEVFIQENDYEKMTEIQMLASENHITEKMIKLFKNTDSVIDALKDDEDDIVFRLAVAASAIKRLNGTFAVDSLGKDGNLVMINLPSNAQTEGI